MNLKELTNIWTDHADIINKYLINLTLLAQPFGGELF